MTAPDLDPLFARFDEQRDRELVHAVDDFAAGAAAVIDAAELGWQAPSTKEFLAAVRRSNAGVGQFKAIYLALAMPGAGRIGGTL
ncbi:hypothetical protein [Amycolatopsis jejuensis]|uniref:hypothetical protein n=1 Tax=Amycolatopsis jejuensis TaxID=330084 RepID=UPI0005242D67|nr:hypothetical protein [Amycolatopsis jejuensis]